VIPINKWKKLPPQAPGFKDTGSPPVKLKIKLSDLAGKLSQETAEEMLNHEAESKWEERLNNPAINKYLPTVNKYLPAINKYLPAV
jgi:hypothetical protein